MVGAQAWRPSHADFTWDARYGLRAVGGGGRASARETAARVAAGAVARQVLESLGPVEVVAWVDEVAGDRAEVDPEGVTLAAVDAAAVPKRARLTFCAMRHTLVRVTTATPAD